MLPVDLDFCAWFPFSFYIYYFRDDIILFCWVSGIVFGATHGISSEAHIWGVSILASEVVAGHTSPFSEWNHQSILDRPPTLLLLFCPLFGPATIRRFLFVLPRFILLVDALLIVQRSIFLEFKSALRFVVCIGGVWACMAIAKTELSKKTKRRMRKAARVGRVMYTKTRVAKVKEDQLNQL